MQASLMTKCSKVWLKGPHVLIWHQLPSNHAQITQQLEGICLQVIGTVLQQHVMGKLWPVLPDQPHSVCALLSTLDGMLHAWCERKRPRKRRGRDPFSFCYLTFSRVLRGDPVIGSQLDLPAGVTTNVAAPSTGVWSLPTGWIWLLHRFTPSNKHLLSMHTDTPDPQRVPCCKLPNGCHQFCVTNT